MKKLLSTVIAALIAVASIVTLVGCSPVQAPTASPVAPGMSFGEEAYEMVKYIDQNLSDRDCIAGENFFAFQEWLIGNLKEAGYKDEAIVKEEFQLGLGRRGMYFKEAELDSVVAKYTLDGKKYAKSGWSYAEDENGEYVKFASLASDNIVVTKPGTGDKQIIIGMHYDGTGTGDNGSGIALGLITAMKLCNVQTDYTLKFIFFSAEEYGLYGSTANAMAMTEEEIASTEYMINMDSLVCGDYCYLYGGVQNDELKTVTQTEAYDNAMAVAADLGLVFLSNPWSYKNPTPVLSNLDEKGNMKEDAMPDYAAPSTGDWSDHVGYKTVGIPYVYFEATNWMLYPDYDGYQETATFGPLMNTENDYLEKIEELFPGRIQKHLNQFSSLLTTLLLQDSATFAA